MAKEQEEFHDKRHSQFEQEVAEFLKTQGMTIPNSMTYHDVMEKQHKKFFSTNDTATTLYIRGRADRLAYLPSGAPDVAPVVFEWECKTCPSYEDLAFEVLPFLHSLMKVGLGVRILYAIRNFLTKRDYGFWVGTPIEFREANLCCRNTWIGKHVEHLLPGLKIINKSSGGSKDPFIIIDKSVAPSLPDWRQLVTEELKFAGCG
jgi:hypothetical protein